LFKHLLLQVVEVEVKMLVVAVEVVV